MKIGKVKLTLIKENKNNLYEYKKILVSDGKKSLEVEHFYMY